MLGERVAQVGVDVKNERARKGGDHPECRWSRPAFPCDARLSESWRVVPE